MGRAFRRVLTFILGMVMGIASILGALVGGSYWAYKNVSLNKLNAGVDGFGSLNDLTIENGIDLGLDIYKNPEKYSIADLEKVYGFDLEVFLKENYNVTLKQDTVSGKENVKALKDVNIALLLKDMGLFLDTVNVRALFNFLPEDVISKGTLARLSQYSLFDLFEANPVTGKLGIYEALESVKLGGLLPSMYEETYDYATHSYIYTAKDSGQQYLDLIGDLNVGSVINSFNGQSDFMTEFLSGRMTSIATTDIDELLYKIISSFSSELAKTVQDYAKVIGEKSISDLFVADFASEEYSFSMESLLSDINIGVLFGYTLENGRWYDGNKDVTDTLLGQIASFDFYSLYQSLDNEGALKNISYQLGDISIGSILGQFMGYEKNAEGKWENPNGKTLNSLTAFAGISVGKILNGTGTIIENLIDNLKESTAGYRIGDFISDFVDISYVNGVWTNANGKPVMSMLNGVYNTEISDFIKDEYSLQTFIVLLKDAIGETCVGELIGCEQTDGVWYDANGNSIDKKLNILYDFKFRNILDIFLTDFSVTQIFKSLLGDLTIGDILETYLDYSYVEGTDTYYKDNGKEAVPALKKLRTVKIWELFAGFDSTSGYDIFDVLDVLSIGDFLGDYNETESYWTLDALFFENDPYRVNGVFNKILDLNLGKMLDPDVSAGECLEPLKGSSVGEYVQSAFSMHKDSEIWKSDFMKVFDFMEVLAEIDTTIDDIIDYASGNSNHTLETFLKDLLGGVRVGDMFGDLMGSEYDGTNYYWYKTSNYKEQPLLLQILLDYVIIDDTFDIINSDNLLDTLKALIGDTEIGDIPALFMDINKESGEWNNASNDMWTILQDVYGIKIVYVLDLITGDASTELIDILTTICGADRTFGDYVDDFANFTYKPVTENVYNVKICEFFDIVVGGNASAYGYEDSIDYLKGVFGDLMVGDLFADFIGYEYVTESSTATLTDSNDGGVGTAQVEKGVWTNNGKEINRLLGALMSVKFSFIFDQFGGNFDVSDFTKGVLGDNTIGYFVEEFYKNEDYKPLVKIYGINIPEFIDIVVEGNAKDYGYTSTMNYFEVTFEDLMLGDTFAEFMGYEYDESLSVWKDGDKEVIRILGALMSVRFSFIFDQFDGNFDVSDFTKGILGDNTIGYFVEEFYKNEDYKPLAKIYDINIPEFIDIVVEGNAKDYGYTGTMDYVEGKFGDLMIGDLFAPFVGYKYDETLQVWTDGTDEILKILNALISVKFSFIFDQFDGNFDPSDFTKGILGDNTIGYFVEEFYKNEDYKPLVKIYDINIPEFVDIIVEGNAKDYGYTGTMDYVEGIFGDLMIGDTFATFMGYEYDESLSVWKDGDKEVIRILGALMSVRFSFIFDQFDGNFDPSDFTKGILGDNTIGYFVEEFYKNEDYKPLVKIYDINIPEFVDIVVEGNAKDYGYTGTMDYVEGKFGDLMIGDTFATFVGYKYDDSLLVWKDGDKEVIRLLGALMSVKFSFIFDQFDGNFDPSDFTKGILGDNTIGYFVEEFYKNEDYKPLVKIYDINIPEFVDIVVEGNAKDYGYTGTMDYVEGKFGDLMIGDTFATFVGYKYDDSLLVWKDGDKEVNRLLGTLMSIRFSFIFDQFDGNFDPSDFTKGILGDNTIGYFVEEFYKNEDYKPLVKIYDTNIPEFVDIVVEGNAKDYGYTGAVDYVKVKFGDLMIGDLFAEFIGYEYVTESSTATLTDSNDGGVGTAQVAKGVWTNNGKEINRLLGALMSVEFNFIFDQFEGSFDVSDFTKGVLGDNTIGYFVEEFLSADDYSLLNSLYAINIPQFVDIVAEGNAKNHGYTDRADYFKGVFGETMVGDLFASFINYSYDEASGDWKNGSKDIDRLLNDIMSIKFGYLIDTISSAAKGENIKGAQIVADICGDNTTIGYYLEKYVKADVYEPLEIVYNIVLAEFVGVLSGDSKDYGYTSTSNYFETLIGALELGDLFGQFIGLDNDSGNWQKDGKEVKSIVEVVLSIPVYKTVEFATGGNYTGDALADYVKILVEDKETIGDLLYDLFTKVDDTSRYGRVFNNGKDIYNVIDELFMINVVELSRKPGEYASDFFGAYKTEDYLAMYGELYGYYYNYDDQKWYDKNGKETTPTLMYVTLGVGGAIVGTVMYFAFNDKLVELCGDKIYYDLIGETLGFTYDEANAKYVYKDSALNSEFYNQLMGMKVGETLTTGYRFPREFKETMNLGNMFAYFIDSKLGDTQMAEQAGVWTVSGDFGQTLTATFNLSYIGLRDSIKAKKVGTYFKDAYEPVTVGDLLTKPLGIEYNLEKSEWYKKNSDKKVINLIGTLYSIKPVSLIDSVVESVKGGKFRYDYLYGDIFGRENEISYFMSDILKHQFNQERQVWVDKANNRLMGSMQVLYGINVYTFLNDGVELGYKKAMENTFGGVLLGDLVCDLFEKVKALELKATKENGVYVNTQEWANLADTLYNISVYDLYCNGKSGNFWLGKFKPLLVGDYVNSLVKKFLKNTQAVYDKDNNKYTVVGEYAKVLTALYNESPASFETGSKANGALNYLRIDVLGEVRIGDLLNKGLYVRSETNGRWYKDGEELKLDFDPLGTITKMLLDYKIQEITEPGFDYLSIADKLYFGNLMTLTKYAEYNDNGTTIYLDADDVYTIVNGEKVYFPYQIRAYNETWYYTNSNNQDIELKQTKFSWYTTYLFEEQYKVTINIDKDTKVATVVGKENGINYPTTYDSVNDVYAVVIESETVYFRVYNGVYYVATPNGDFYRGKQTQLMQKIAEINVGNVMKGFDIQAYIGGFYVGEIMDYYKNEETGVSSAGFKKYYWYKTEDTSNADNRVDALDQVLSNFVLQTLFDKSVDIKKEFQDLKVKEVVTNAENIPVIKVFANSTLNSIESEMKFMKIGEVMGKVQTQVAITTSGDYVYRTTFSQAGYDFYLRRNNQNIYGTISGKTFTSSSNEVIDLEVWQMTNIWSESPNIADDGLKISGNNLITKDGAVVTSLTTLMDGETVYYNTGDGRYIVKVGLDKYYWTYSNREVIYEPVTDEIINLVADIGLAELDDEDFGSKLSTRLLEKLHIGTFFKASTTGVFALFTQEELNEISIKQFPDRVLGAFQNATMQKLGETGLFELTDEEQRKIALIDPDWENKTLDVLIEEIVAQLPAA